MIRNLIKILLIFVVFLTGVVLLYKIKPLTCVLLQIFLPFVFGAGFAFLLNPFVDFLEKRHVSRKAGCFIVVFLFLFIFFILGVFFLPNILKECKSLMQNFEMYVNNLEKILNSFLKELKIKDEIDLSFDRILSFLKSNKHVIFKNFLEIIQKSFSYLSIVLITPVLMLYFLIDYHKITKAIKEFLHSRGKKKVVLKLEKVSKVLKAYASGVFFVFVIMSLTSTIAFFIIGIDYSLFWGILIGITNIIPYIGPYIGGAIVGIFTLSTEPSKLFSVILFIVIIQFLESSFITPQIESKTTKIHPIFVIFSVLFFGKLFGIIGMIFALPIFLIIDTYRK